MSLLRESALERADEEEEQKLFQNKVKQKKGASHAITKSVNSDTGTTVKQKQEKKVADETVNRRTVFVGNLPVNCTAQVCEWIMSAKGAERISAALSLRGCFQLRNHTYL